MGDVPLSDRPPFQQAELQFRRDWIPDCGELLKRLLAEVPQDQQQAALRHLVQVDMELCKLNGIPVDATRYAAFGLGAENVESALSQLGLDPPAIHDTEPWEADSCEQCGSRQAAGNEPIESCTTCGSSRLLSRFDESEFEFDPPPTTAARFVLKGRIGQGGFGVVYKAWDTKLRRHVALKMPKRSFAGNRLLAREARAASRLRHTGIVSIFDVIELEDLVIVVSDFIDGPTLSRYRLRHSIDLKHACRITIQLAEAMDHAHAQDVIHRDLKPSNIVMDEQGNPHILDFGLSRSRYESQPTLLERGIPIGTPAYMPPEQARGEHAQIGTPSDVYSLGVIFYQLLTGHLPFSGDVEEILHDLQNRPLASTRVHDKQIPAAVDAIVLKALSKRPDDRYQVAGDLARDIKRFLRDERVTAYPQTDLRVFKRWAKRWSLPILAGVLLLAFGISLSLWRHESNLNNPYRQVEQPVSRDIKRLVWYRYNEQTGQLSQQGTEQFPDRPLALRPGFYRIQVELADGDHWEVFRTIPQYEEVPQLRPGIPLNHRYWDVTQNRRVKLPRITASPASRDEQATRVPSGHLRIANAEVAPMTSRFVAGSQTEMPAFWISTREYTLTDVLKAFPDAGLTFVDADVAIAFCEHQGASLPTVLDYAWLEQQDADLPELKTGVMEWTSTPKRRVAITVSGRIVSEQSANLDEFLYIRSVKPDAPMKLDTPVTSQFSITPANRLGNNGEAMGFRLKWMN